MRGQQIQHAIVKPVRPQSIREQKHERSQAWRDRQEAVEALHAMQAARPLRPPPCNFAQRQRSAAALALQADKRAGVW